MLGENPEFYVYATLTNTSDHGGTFQLYATVTSQGNKLEFLIDAYVPAGATREMRQTKEINPFSFEADVTLDSWGIRAPTITVEEEVTKTREVLKYRRCNTCVEDCKSLVR